MFALIKKLQRQPTDVRRKVGLSIAGGITLVIFLLWLLTLVIRPSVQEAPTRTESPLSTLGTLFNTAAQTVQEQRSQLNF